MTRARALTSLLTAGAILVGAHSLAAEAASVPDDAVAPSRAVVKPLIQGVVVDQDGRPVDGVKVQALREDGTPQSSAETYASDREDGPQHGYFFVEVAQGPFRVTLSKDGYRTVEYDAGTITRPRQRLSLGEIEITKLAASTTTASLARDTVTTKDRGAVRVTVASKATGRPTGDVEVREGRTVVGTATLTRSGKGSVTVTLDRLAKGNHTLRAHFLGTDALRASISGELTLHVVRKKR